MDTPAPPAAAPPPVAARAQGVRRQRIRLAAWFRRLARPRMRSGIGIRLGVLALALGLPFVVYVGGNAARQAALERQEVKQRTLFLARLFAARIDDYVGDMQSALALVAHGVQADEASAAANDAFLQRIRADLPRAVANAAVWTIDGRNVGALDHAGMRGGVRVADREYFKAAVTTRATAFEGPLESRVAGEPIVVFARAMLGADGRVIGVVTVASRLRDLGWLLDVKGAAPDGTVVSVVNEQGVVLVRNIDAAHWIGRSVRGVGNAQAHIAEREGVDETRGADNIARIAGYTQTSRTPWHVFVGIPAEDALAAARTNLREMLLFGTLSLLIGAWLAARLGARIAKPLRQLAYDALRFARGDLSHRTGVRGDDETGVLAATLNRMAQIIEDRTRALEEKTAACERSTVELATITANVPVLIAYVDAEQHFRFVNEYFRDVFGFAPERIIGQTLREVFGPDVHARLDGRIRDVLTGLPQTFEASFAADGRPPVFIVTCFPDCGDGDHVRGAYVVCQDITRRKEAEDALEARERFVRLITDAIPARITYSDPSERLLFGNRRFAEFWGSDPKAIVGRQVRDVVSADAYAQIGPELARSYRGESRRFNLVVPRKHGTLHYQVDHVPDIDARGNVHGIVTISQDVTALREAKQALAESERRMRLVADNLPALIVYVSADERYMFVNARCRQMFGVESEQMVGRKVSELLSPAAYAQTSPHIARVRSGERARFQRSSVRNGRTYHELVELIPDRAENGDVIGFYGLVQDVTDLRDAQARVEESEQRLRRITDNIPSMVAYIDAERRYRFNSRYYETWLGRPLSDITGRLVQEVLGAETYATIRSNLDRAFEGERVEFEVEVRGTTGSRFVRGAYIPDVDASGNVVGIYSSSTDITPQKQVERQLERLAQNDTLTGLPNRHMFNDGIAAALRRSQRSGTHVALLFLDIDGFKQINDTLGHAGGDDVLREFAHRLKSCVRATDLVARLAGDEFVIVLEGIHTRDECRFVARKILAAMRPQFRTAGCEIRVTTSIGVALGHGSSTTAEALLKRADSALYAAKGQGRDRFEMAI